MRDLNERFAESDASISFSSSIMSSCITHCLQIADLLGDISNEFEKLLIFYVYTFMYLCILFFLYLINDVFIDKLSRNHVLRIAMALIEINNFKFY